MMKNKPWKSHMKKEEVVAVVLTEEEEEGEGKVEPV